MGAWIEILYIFVPCKSSKSLLSWERGLKYCQYEYGIFKEAVAPLVGAWIEINGCTLDFWHAKVAPLVGAWIEIELL